MGRAAWCPAEPMVVTLALLAGCSNLSSLTQGTSGNDAGDAPLAAGDTSGPDAAVDAPGACATDPCVMATGLDKPVFIATDSKNVYWTELGDMLGGSSGAAKSCPLAGCGAGPLVYAGGLENPPLGTSLTTPVAVAVSGPYVFWLSLGTPAPSNNIVPSTGALLRHAK